MAIDDLPPPPPPPPSNSVPAPPSELPPPPPPTKKKGWGDASKKQPLNIEEMLRRKKEEQAAAAKPKFLSKAERERLALERREKEAEEQKRREETALEQKRLFYGINTQNGSAKISAGGPLEAAIPRGPKGFRGGGDIPTGPAAMRGPEATSEPAAEVASKRVAPEDATEAMIRERYMGRDPNQSTFSAAKKRKRTTEKKFNFEWNPEEDTSRDDDPYYKDRIQWSFFGRGKLGGFDDSFADKAAEKYREAIIQRDPETGPARVQELIEMERRSKEKGSRTAIDKHWSEKQLDEMQERDWRIFKEDFNISSKGGHLPNPMRSWKESDLPSELLGVVDKVGYTEPSAIQRAAIPIALQSRDLIGVAVTGSGKTAAFVLPLLVYISELPALNDYTKADGPYAIILAPTRELAQQIEVETRKFATPLGFRCVSIVGGHSINEQIRDLEKGAEIVIATPGRLVDCIESRVLVLGQCCYVIMDEADRMIDLGFEEPVNKILDALPVGNAKPDSDAAENAVAMSRSLGGKDRYRQTMMYTATMPTAVERIARKYLRRPATVTIGNVGEAVETVEQRVEFVAGEDKRKKRMLEILQSHQYAPPIIVFVNIKRNCDAVAKDISYAGYRAVTLHGGKDQTQREAALASLRNGKMDVLVATDLAGRGIDVADVSLVINFNMATSIESYTHRIGRTGRAGKSGVAITFLGNEDSDVMYDLKQMLMKSSISRVPEELRRHEAAQQKRERGAPKKDIE